MKCYSEEETMNFFPTLFVRYKIINIALFPAAIFENIKLHSKSPPNIGRSIFFAKSVNIIVRILIYCI